MRRGWFFLFAMLCLCAAPAWAVDVELLSPGADLPSDASCRAAALLTFAERQVVIHDGACELANARVLALNVAAERLYLVRDHRPVADRLGYAVLYGRHGVNLALVTDLEGLRLEKDVRLDPVGESRELLATPTDGKGDPDPVVEGVLAELNIASLTEYLTELAIDLPTRYSCTTEVLTARDSIVAHFDEMGLETTTPGFPNLCWDCEDVDGFNVVGVKTGTVRPDEYYLIGAHYDSTSPNPCNLAPGANDNGSGVAAVLEIARVLAAHDTEASIIFVAFGGEELGLLGSQKLMQNLEAAGIDGQLKGFVVLDMIAFYQDTYGALLEGSNGNPAQIETLQQIGGMAYTYTDLSVAGTYNYCCSDHEPFLDAGVPGALIIESDWDQYAYYHTVNDTMNRQNMDYGLEMTRLAAAAIATWAVVADQPADDDDDNNDDNDDTTDDDSADDDTADDDTADDDTADDDTGDDDAADDDDNDSGGACGC